MLVHFTRSEADTEAVAATLADTLAGGDAILLSGDLGAGKTAFVRGLARGLGIDPEEVSSPTFTLIHEYGGGRLVLFHADLYRLDGAAVEDLGLEELGVRDGVLAIEWPDRLSHAMAGAIRVDISVEPDERRRITVATTVSPAGST